MRTPVVIWFGYALLVVAVIYFLYKVYVSYSSAGGTQFELPVYDAAIYPPVMFTVGGFLVLRAAGVSWPFWAYLGIWVAATAVSAGVIRLAEELGDRPLR